MQSIVLLLCSWKSILNLKKTLWTLLCYKSSSHILTLRTNEFVWFADGVAWWFWGIPQTTSPNIQQQHNSNNRKINDNFSSWKKDYSSTNHHFENEGKHEHSHPSKPLLRRKQIWWLFKVDQTFSRTLHKRPLPHLPVKSQPYRIVVH